MQPSLSRGSRRSTIKNFQADVKDNKIVKYRINANITFEVGDERQLASHQEIATALQSYGEPSDTIRLILCGVYSKLRRNLGCFALAGQL
jgi:hypothetical protein